VALAVKAAAVDQVGLIGVELAAGDDVIMNVDDHIFSFLFLHDVIAVLFSIKEHDGCQWDRVWTWKARSGLMAGG
jgi:hypothetical protein